MGADWSSGKTIYILLIMNADILLDLATLWRLIHFDFAQTAEFMLIRWRESHQDWFGWCALCVFVVQPYSLSYVKLGMNIWVPIFSQDRLAYAGVGLLRSLSGDNAVSYSCGRG